MLSIFQPLCSQSALETLNRTEIIRATEAVAAVFETKYILPEAGKKIAELIRKNMNVGVYNNLLRGQDLASRLQKDAQSVNGDRHISINFSPDRIKDRLNPKLQKKLSEEARRRARMINHGFEEIHILAGNVGYLKMNRFMGSPAAFETAAAAMQFLANCDAVIIDLRWNPGGESTMVQFLSSYFLGEEPQLLDVFHFRENNRIEQVWSLPSVPGHKLEHADLYFLTSGLTFSAAEGMAYDLQALKRAVVVGETTMGGAHPVDIVTIEDKFLVSLPYAFSRNPITQGNFEGTGVKPDVVTDREDALSKAHSLALERRIDKEDNKTVRSALKWAADGIPIQSVTIPADIKKSYTGSYGPNKILFEKGNLFYLFGPGKLRMAPITKDFFSLENFDGFRVKIVKQDNSVTGIEVIYQNGSVERFARVENIKK